jgi:alpha-ribazole phosphatase
MKVILIRHATPLIAPGICYGRLDIAADPAATEAVCRCALSRPSTGVMRVWTSPARRCSDLAKAIGLSLAVTVTVDPRLQELDFGAWEGKSWNDVARAELDVWAASPLTFAPPGGESGAMLMMRVHDFCTGLRRDQQNCIVVSHGGPLKVLAALLLGMPVDLLAPAPAIGSIETIVCAAARSPA